MERLGYLVQGVRVALFWTGGVAQLSRLVSRLANASGEDIKEQRAKVE